MLMQPMAKTFSYEPPKGPMAIDDDCRLAFTPCGHPYSAIGVLSWLMCMEINAGGSDLDHAWSLMNDYKDDPAWFCW